MYDFECLTTNEAITATDSDMCSPYWGACIPEAEGCCGPDCNPSC